MSNPDDAATAKLLRVAANVIEEYAGLMGDDGVCGAAGILPLDARLIAELRGRANILDPATATPIPPAP